MSKNTVFLIIGIIVFLLGMYQNFQYEENSLIVEATVTRTEIKEDTDDGSERQILYGEYTVNGKKYTDKKLGTRHSDFLKRGDTVEIRVYPEHPEFKVAEGGVFGVVGFVLIVYNSVKLHKAQGYVIPKSLNTETAE